MVHIARPRCQLHVAYCQLRVACCQLHVAYCQLRVACCQLRAARCLLPVARCLASVACCMLRVQKVVRLVATPAGATIYSHAPAWAVCTLVRYSEHSAYPTLVVL
jgi:hypothetical protein